MKVKVQLEIDELKDGSYIAKINQINIGEVSDINVEEKLNTLHSLISAKKYFEQSEDLGDIKQKLNESIEQSIRIILAQLLAYYYIDF